MQCTPSLASLALYWGDVGVPVHWTCFPFLIPLSYLQALEICPTFCLTNQRGRSPGALASHFAMPVTNSVLLVSVCFCSDSLFIVLAGCFGFGFTWLWTSYCVSPSYVTYSLAENCFLSWMYDVFSLHGWHALWKTPLWVSVFNLDKNNISDKRLIAVLANKFFFLWVAQPKHCNSHHTCNSWVTRNSLILLGSPSQRLFHIFRKHEIRLREGIFSFHLIVLERPEAGAGRFLPFVLSWPTYS